MSVFDKCYDKLLANEGGYANHPNDKGKETYKGIARRYHPNWEGWNLIDQYKNMNGFPQNAYLDEELTQLVRDFYKLVFWDRMRLDLIVNENSVLQLFDMAVNSGIKTAVKLAQEVCGVSLDGILGPNTAFKINEQGFTFVNKYIKARDAYYRKLALSDPTQKVFLNGWIARAKHTKF